MKTVMAAASGLGRLTVGQTTTNTPEIHYSNQPCVISQSSNTKEREREREEEKTKIHVKEHRTSAHPDSLIDGCRE